MQEYKPNTGKELIEVGTDSLGRKFVRIYNNYHYTYHKYGSCKEMIWSLGIGLTPRKDMKSYYKEAGDAIGVSPSAALKWYNAIAYKTFVACVDNFHVKKFALCPVRKKVKPEALANLHRVAGLLDQVKKDGIYNVAPLVFVSGDTPQKLKVELGKGLWKKLHKNSFHRNQLLGRASIRNKDSYEDIPSSLLHLLHGMFPCKKETVLYVKEKMKGKWTNKNACKRVASFYEDTKRLAVLLNRDFSKNWSVEKLEEEHNRFIQLYNNRARVEREIQDANIDTPIKYNDEPFTEFNHGEFTAVRLNTMWEYNNEGKKMSHCVGSYRHQAYRGDYICYHICMNGEDYSTLGIYRDHRGVRTHYIFNQHYKKHNHEVDVDSAKEFATMLVSELNKASHSQFANSEQTVKE